MEDNSVLKFYDQMAGSYHLIFEDWRESVERQGQVLDTLIRAEGFGPPARLLDCACGIGTQAIGLAARGYRVHATDLSPAAAERAAREAAAIGVSLSVGAADMRNLEREVSGRFEVVIACDNALPHLLEPEELRQAIRSIQARLEPGGLFLASTRDYDQLLIDRPGSTLPRVVNGDEGQRISFQVWEWTAERPIYTVNQFILREVDGRWQTEHYRTRYRALRRAELGEALAETGFEQVRWRMPEESGFYQPVVTARKRRE